MLQKIGVGFFITSLLVQIHIGIGISVQIFSCIFIYIVVCGAPTAEALSLLVKVPETTTAMYTI